VVNFLFIREVRNMRKTLFVVMSLMLMLGMSGMALAGEGGQMVKGKVVSIDPTGKTIVIGTPEGEKTVIFQEETQGLRNVAPGMEVEMTCLDVEGKSCVKDVKVISATGAGMPARTMEGKVVSIDPDGKSVVIRSSSGAEMKIEVMTEKAEKVMPMPEAKTEEKMMVTTMPVKEIKPGEMIKVDCFDSEGKFCASRITVISPEEAGMAIPGGEVMGEVVSIDPDGKSIVVGTPGGKKTLYFQKATTGAAMSEMEVGKKIRAYCLDIEGKSCIRSIEAE